MKGMKYLLLFMNKEIIIRFTILHAHITHPVQKKRHWILIQKNMRYDTYSLALNIEEISYKAIIESNKLLQSEAVSKNK